MAKIRDLLAARQKEFEVFENESDEKKKALLAEKAKHQAGVNEDSQLETKSAEEIKHLQEELMDATLYLEKLMSLEKRITDLVREHPNDAELGYLIRKLVK